MTTHSTTPAPAHIIDAVDLICPMPVLKTRKALEALPAGAILELHANDPAAPLDIRAFCACTGHELLSLEETGGVTVFRIRKAG